MTTKVIIAAFAIVALAGCTSSAAPAPGDRSMAMVCEKGTVKVCTGLKGSRLEEQKPHCSCN